MKYFIKGLLIVLAVVGCGNVYGQKQGQAFIDSLLQELPKQKEDTNKVRILNRLSFRYADINPDEGIKSALQGLDLATKLNWTRGMGGANNSLGRNYFAKYDYRKALEYYLLASKLHEETGNQQDIVHISQSLETVYEQLGNYPSALEYCFKALKMYEAMGEKAEMATLLNTTGTVYKKQHDYTNAMKYDLQSLKISEDIGDKQGIAAITCNIGQLYGEQGDYAKALDYFQKALKLDKEINNAVYTSYVISNIASVYQSQNNYAMALQYDFISLKESEENGDKYGIALNMLNVGGDYLSLATDTAKRAKGVEINDYKADHVAVPGSKKECLNKAVEYLQKSMALNKDVKSMDVLQSCYDNLGQAYRLTGDYKKALEASDHFHAIKDSIYTKENDKKMIQQGMKYEYEKKEAITNLASEKALQRQKLVRDGFGGGFAVVLVFAGVFFSQRNKIKAGKKKSDELLLNILPSEVADELKTKGAAEAKLIDEVTVLFTDFTGFTRLAEKLTPKALVAEINECFSAFDHIMEKYGVEKIKTIGDAYMAAGGLPTANKTHPEDVVNAALEIQKYMTAHKAKKEATGELYFEVRIGIHSGPVVAGIVGVKKFQYDIWGDTVNTANRMESSGEVGKVNISETTYELVKDKFACEYRGEIEAKNKGMLKMYFVDQDLQD